MLADSAKLESGNEEEEEEEEEDDDEEEEEQEEEDDDYDEEEEEEELLHASREGNTETLARLLLVSNKADLNKATSQVKSLLACSVQFN
jgi:ABC-type Zn2+ transport system substrate-binding protein/surface adhesin